MNFEENPYRPPESGMGDDPPGQLPQDEPFALLASRGERLGASLLDALVMMLLVIPPLAFLGFYDGIMAGEQLSYKFQISAAVFGFVVWLAVNWYFLKTNGQTLGKKVLGIKIVKKDGNAAEMSRLVGLRYGIGALIVHVPIAGSIYAFVDSLFIFGGDKRCVHDYIAGTIVIKE